MLLIFVPFVIVSAGKIGRRVRTTTRKGQDKLADIQNILHESIAGNRIVKAFGMENWESSRFHGRSQKTLPRQPEIGGGAVRQLASDGYSRRLAIALLLWVGRSTINSGADDARRFYRIYYCCLSGSMIRSARWHFSITAFSRRWARRRRYFVSSTKRTRSSERPDAIALPAFRERVRFENVSFAYSGANGPETEILHNVNLETRAGEVVAIVGSSGAGKTHAGQPDSAVL